MGGSNKKKSNPISHLASKPASDSQVDWAIQVAKDSKAARLNVIATEIPTAINATASPTHAITTQVEGEEENHTSDPSGFLISDPSKSVVYGVGNEIIDLSKLTDFDLSEEELELHEDWEERASNSSSQDEVVIRRPRREHHFHKLQDSNEIRRRKIQAQAQSGVGAAQKLIRQLHAEIQGLYKLKQGQIKTLVNRRQASSKAEKSNHGSYIWKAKKRESHSDSDCLNSKSIAPSLRSYRSDIADDLHSACKREENLLFDPKSRSTVGTKEFTERGYHAHFPSLALSNGHKHAVVPCPEVVGSHMGSNAFSIKPGALSPCAAKSKLLMVHSAGQHAVDSHVAPYVDDCDDNVNPISGPAAPPVDPIGWPDGHMLFPRQEPPAGHIVHVKNGDYSAFSGGLPPIIVNSSKAQQAGSSTISAPSKQESPRGHVGNEKVVHYATSSGSLIPNAVNSKVGNAEGPPNTSEGLTHSIPLKHWVKKEAEDGKEPWLVTL